MQLLTTIIALQSILSVTLAAPAANQLSQRTVDETLVVDSSIERASDPIKRTVDTSLVDSEIQAAGKTKRIVDEALVVDSAIERASDPSKRTVDSALVVDSSIERASDPSKRSVAGKFTNTQIEKATKREAGFGTEFIRVAKMEGKGKVKVSG
ncbi:hypothetical protein MMC21_003846 [Puttea exsequens]|nr:hypothetical protein [Puttea exsequens]